jgi:hypothetical protein
MHIVSKTKAASSAPHDLGDRFHQTEAHRRWIASNSGPVD